MNSNWMRGAAGVLALVLMIGLLPHAALAQSVRVTTDMGAFTIELQPDRAPLTVENFLKYVNEGFYSGTLIHRVVSGFVVQGGGHAATDYRLKTTHAPVYNESGNGLQNKRGWVGMARSGAPHSGNSQFYVNIADNPELDPLPTRWGYAVFGRVTDGMDVLDKIGVVATGSMGPFKSEAPLKPIVIEKVELVGASSAGPGSAVNRAVMPSSEGAPGSPPASAAPGSPASSPPIAPGGTAPPATSPPGATQPPK
jgi:cyclophilin family peptidyl-prolyl cis-trans isomerase